MFWILVPSLWLCLHLHHLFNDKAVTFFEDPPAAAQVQVGFGQKMSLR